MRKRIGIEAFLRWAYRDELPKALPEATGFQVAGFGAAWGGIERFGEVLTVIDAPSNDYGLVPDFGAIRDPHPDAVMADHAVRALADLELGLPDDWDPAGDLRAAMVVSAGQGSDAEAALAREVATGLSLALDAAVGRARDRLTVLDVSGRRAPRHSVADLVVRFALTGHVPAWEADPATLELVTGPKGRPRWFRRVLLQGEAGGYEVEVDGYDHKAHRPHPDAYRRFHLDPCPEDALVARGEYELWMAALAHLVDELGPHLADYALEASPRPVRPWETGDLSPARVLPSVLPAVAVPAKRAARAGPRPQRRRAPITLAAIGA